MAAEVGDAVSLRTHTFSKLTSSGLAMLGRISGEWSDGINMRPKAKVQALVMPSLYSSVKWEL